MSQPTGTDDAEASRPLKKPRLEDTGAGSPLERKQSDSTIIRSEKYWFEDGNIVLRIEDTMFRVHRGVISRYSTVFNDLFAVPQPPSGEPVVEGCAVVQLSGDKADDWGNLLSIIYDHDTTYNSMVLQLSLLNSMLRLGKKYQIDSLHKAALDQLGKVLPTTLGEWSALQMDQLTRTEDMFDTVSALDLFSTIMEHKLQKHLPVAYYYCISEATLSDILDSHSSSKKTPFLSPSTLRKMITGREKLRWAIVQNLFPWAFSHRVTYGEIDNCLDPGSDGSCEGFRSLTVENLCARSPFHLMLLPFNDRQVKIYLIQDDIELCAVCTVAAEREWNKGRGTLWDHLPSYFGLPKWEDLKNA